VNQLPNRGTRIGIDGRFLAGNLTGRGRYIFELCRDLDRAMPEAQFSVYAPYAIALPPVSCRWTVRVDRAWGRALAKSAIWLTLRAGQLCRQDGVDAFWAAGTLLPLLPREVTKVATVYDLNHLIVPNTMKYTGLLSYRLLFRESLRRADAIISMSRGTANRLYDLLGFKSAAIVTPGVAPAFALIARSEMTPCLNLNDNQYSALKPYILAVATGEPRKNLELLIDTVLQMKREGLLATHRLVLAGEGGWKDRRLKRIVSAATEAGALTHLGYVAEYFKPNLYRSADVFVFPSIYEGFGMPVLEARACGTPVVTSDIPELREAGGPDAIYVSPTLDGIRSGILTALKQTRSEVCLAASLGWEGRAQALAAALRGQLKDAVAND
jgi:glycosyltransferase involved in cell wall biosynthesis